MVEQQSSRLTLERWQSGLMRALAKGVMGKPIRGFESPSLLHFIFLSLLYFLASKMLWVAPRATTEFHGTRFKILMITLFP